MQFLRATSQLFKHFCYAHLAVSGRQHMPRSHYWHYRIVVEQTLLGLFLGFLVIEAAALRFSTSRVNALTSVAVVTVAAGLEMWRLQRHFAEQQRLESLQYAKARRQA